MSRLVFFALMAAAAPLFLTAPPAHAAMISKGLKIDPLLQQAIADTAHDGEESPSAAVEDAFADFEAAAAERELALLAAPPAALPPLPPPAPPATPPRERARFHWPEKPGHEFAGLLFLPSLLLRTGWDDNIYAEDGNDTTADSVTIVSPRLRIEIPGIRHDVSFEGSWDATHYMRNDNENTNAASARLGGALVASKGISLPFDFGWTRKHEAREDDLTRELPESPLPWDSLAASGGIRFAPGPFGIALLGHFTQDRFEDGEGKFTNLPVIRSDANRDILSFEFNTSFNIDPQNTLMLWGTIGKRDYQHPNYQAGGFTGPERDSHTYTGALSWLFDFSDLKGHASAGLSNYGYDDPALKDVRLFTGDLELDHKLSDRVSVNLQLVRELGEDVEITDPYAHSRAGLYVDYRAWDDVLIAAGGDYGTMEFLGTNRKDDVTDLRLIGDYFINDFLSLGAEYVHTGRSSSAAGLDYGRNLFLLRARGRL